MREKNCSKNKKAKIRKILFTVRRVWLLFVNNDEVSGIGTLGNSINNGLTEYSSPCSQGFGDKTYIYTVYALSAQPQLSMPDAEVDRDTLLAAMQGIILGSAELNVVYARRFSGEGQSESAPAQSGRGGGAPPQASYDACAGQTGQASCSFTSDKGTESGVCKTVLGALACSPGITGGGSAGNPQGGGATPPAEAIAA